ncbi:thiol-disulfide isomerase/thioredoxin [Sphingobacterium paludis]|uniref:Thiol-disulfide isomerase/thioredoxin n=2 Tax=Sphingobacterium paludis TaxID=1476465 RepID=A0A4R7CXB2_9SPHI|nr:thiol-disulfide isomerase/thioredoxin [Sphingobacterium paludis]
MFNLSPGRCPAVPLWRRSAGLGELLPSSCERYFALPRPRYKPLVDHRVNESARTALLSSPSYSVARAHQESAQTERNTKRRDALNSGVHRFFLPMGLFFVVLFSSLSAAFAQEPRDRGADGSRDNGGLRIGDEIPEEFWNLSLTMLDPGQKLTTRSMRDYAESELLVLDFWSTWCGSCISSMKHGEALRNTYGDRLSLLLVTTQTANEVVSFSQKNDIVANTSLPLVINDAALRMFFRHKTLPHMVFIRNNKVLHIGGSESMNDALFGTALRGGKPQVNYYKDDFAFNKPLIGLGNIAANGPKLYNVLSGYRQDSAPVEGLLADSALGTKRVYYYNQPLLTLMLRALQKDAIPLNRVVFENTAYTLESINYHTRMGDKLPWLVKHSLCYESVAPLDANDSLLRENMADALERMLGIRFTLEDRRVKVLRLQSGGTLATSAGEESRPLFHVFDTYNRLPSSLPLIDPDSLTNGRYYPRQDTAKLTTEQLLTLIKEAGLRVVPDQAVMPVLVIKGRNYGTL